MTLPILIKASQSNTCFFLKSYIYHNALSFLPHRPRHDDATISITTTQLEHLKGPALLEKRSFVLRSDFKITTGGEKTTLYSLAMPEGRYDGSIIYAGVICPKKLNIDVFLSEENQRPLTYELIKIIESYLSLRLGNVYGVLPIIFYDQNNVRLPFFSTRLQLPRIYTESKLHLLVESATDFAKYTSIQSYIQQNIPPLISQFPNYENEEGINPAYQNIAQIQSTCFLNKDEKRIWVLRSDFILATGVKNAYKNRYGYKGLADTFSPAVHHFLNWSNRSGHPSLALAEGSYDGTVLYAGYICQRDGFLQVYLSSGRFDRSDLNAEKMHILESYIAAIFQVTYGRQDIVFEFAIPGNPAYHSVFFGDGLFPAENPRRRYTFSSIQETFEHLTVAQHNPIPS